jgi:hypothetical protein
MGGFMWLRLLVLLPLLFLSQISLSQPPRQTKRQVPKTCPVTTAAAHRFVPPWPYQVDSVNWFGNDRFWTILPADGTSSRGKKTFWFRQEWGFYGRDQWIPEKDAGKLTVTVRMLDGSAPPAEILKANSSYREEDWKAFLVGGINFSTKGCWEVFGRYEDDELKFVVWVSP